MEGTELLAITFQVSPFPSQRIILPNSDIFANKMLWAPFKLLFIDFTIICIYLLTIYSFSSINAYFPFAHFISDLHSLFKRRFLQRSRKYSHILRSSSPAWVKTVFQNNEMRIIMGSLLYIYTVLIKVIWEASVSWTDVGFHSVWCESVLLPLVNK